MRRRKPRTVYPEGRTWYAVEVYENPKGIYVQRRFAQHGCQIPWATLKGVLRRGRLRGHTK
jgi:hypothetical protein